MQGYKQISKSRPVTTEDVHTNKQTFSFISIFYEYNFVIVSWLGAFWRQMKIKHLGRDFMSVCAISCVGTCWSWASSTVHYTCILILNSGVLKSKDPRFWKYMAYFMSVWALVEVELAIILNSEIINSKIVTTIQ